MTDITLVDTNALREQIESTSPEDTLAEAGRKILLKEFVKMLAYQNGSRSGEDPEDVHQMRVATRRMRSAFRLLDPYYKNKPVRPFVGQLKKLAKALGAVRDLDVMIAYFERGSNNPLVIAFLRQKEDKARRRLTKYLDSAEYNGFVRAFSAFLTTPGKAAKPIENELAPHQVRHVLPSLIHDHLASVRAYDTVLPTEEIATLHALRIEFKHLRYAIQHFEDVLGASGEQFVEHTKEVQDYLGDLHDMHVARALLIELRDGMDENAPERERLEAEINALTEAETAKVAGFIDLWNKFNTRTMQKKLSDALLVLR